MRLQEIYKAYRLRLHRLALDELPKLAPKTEFTAEKKFVSRIWVRTMRSGLL